MARGIATENHQKVDQIIQIPRIGSPVDRILNRECDGDALIAGLKEDPVVNFRGFSINFNDDLWDFTRITDTNVNKCLLKISFADNSMKDIFKLYFLIQTIWETAKVQTLYASIKFLKKWALELRIEPDNIRLLSADKVRGCINSLRERVSMSYLSKMTSTMHAFLKLYEKLWGRLIDSEVLELLRTTSITCGRIAQESEGWPAIPSDYLKPLMDTAYSTMINEGSDSRDRITAAAVILLERLGFRIGECLALEAGAIEVVPGPYGMPDIAQLSFRTWKGKYGNGAYIAGSTIIDELSLEAYLTLERICESQRRKLDVKTLIVYPLQRDAFCSNSSFKRFFHLFLLENKDKIPCINTQDSFPDLQTMPVVGATLRYHRKDIIHNQAKTTEPGLGEDSVLVYPVFHSFRVSFATRLYESGLNFDIIAKLMNQVSREMAAGYVRSNKRIEHEYSSVVYQAMLEDDARLLGSHADEFAVKVTEHATKIKGEVHGDIREIIAACAEHYPLRRKVGGVCIRCGNVVECPSNSPTDHVFCAFGVCANQCHIYFMADVQLEIVREHIALVEENARRGHSKAAVNELRKAKNVLEGMLLPELTELDRQLELHGAKHILDRHPQLKEIIENRNEIDEEIEKWKSMQL